MHRVMAAGEMSSVKRSPAPNTMESWNNEWIKCMLHKQNDDHLRYCKPYETAVALRPFTAHLALAEKSGLAECCKILAHRSKYLHDRTYKTKLIAMTVRIEV